MIAPDITVISRKRGNIVIKRRRFRSGIVLIPKKAEEQPVPIRPYHTDVLR